jgi:hypothetical protein
VREGLAGCVRNQRWSLRSGILELDCESCHQKLLHLRCKSNTRSHATMTRFKLLPATARLSVIIATSLLVQVIQGHSAYAFHHTNGNAGIDSMSTRARDVTGISRETSGTSGAASASCAIAGNETASRPWSASVGHCQPHAVDIPSSSSESTAQQFFDQENAIIDRKIQRVCRGC